MLKTIKFFDFSSIFFNFKRIFIFLNGVTHYLIGNTDRHWGNWGFWVDNKTNKVLKLHPLMDYNKAFLSYDKISGARCQTSDKPKSQQQAAEEAVRAVGLNQIKEIDPAWFADVRFVSLQTNPHFANRQILGRTPKQMKRLRIVQTDFEESAND